jgi:hypothetical protein
VPSTAIERDHLVAIARRDDSHIERARARRQPVTAGAALAQTGVWSEIQRALGAPLVALGRRVPESWARAPVRRTTA